MAVKHLSPLVRQFVSDEEDSPHPVRVEEPVLAETLREAALERIGETGRLVLMLSAARWGAGGGAQRPEQLATVLAQKACVVHLAPGNQDQVPRKRHLPFLSHALNALEWMALPAPRKMAYIAIASPLALNVVAEAPPECVVVYDCIDDWRHFPNSIYKRTAEQTIVRRADLVTCTARRLMTDIKDFGVRRPPPIKFLPNSTQLVGQAWGEKPREVDCVFVGWLSDEWLDWELFERVADRHSLRIIGGRIPPGRPFEHENVEWVGQVPNEELVAYLSEAKVGIAPFANVPLVKAVWPIKYPDYLAAGLPTVASHLPELEGEPYARVCYSKRAFVAAVDRAVVRDWPREAIADQARGCTAEARGTQLIRWLEREGLW